MSAKGYIISFSLAGTVAAVSLWVFQGDKPTAVPAGAPAVKTARHVPVKRTSPPPVAKAGAPASPAAREPVVAAASKPGSSGRALTARAARVEQEANHDLRRLVELLALNEGQQDRVFQTLAEHSPSWTPGLQVAPPAGSASSAGKRSGAALPGFSADPVAKGPVVETPAATGAPVVDQPVADTDPLDEIMALLDPDQQDTLLKDEMDRAAWWAEVLEQITPTDDVPLLIPAVPGTGAGDVQTYEGSDVLE